MSSVSGWNSAFRNNLEQQLAASSEHGATAALVGKEMVQTEVNLMTAIATAGKNPSAENVAKVEELQVSYKRIGRVYEALQQILKNIDEISRRAISNLSLR